MSRWREFLPLLWIVLAFAAIFVFLALPYQVSAIAAPVIAAFVGAERQLVRWQATNSALCPVDGGPLFIQARHWGSRGTPLLVCPRDEQRFAVTSWKPFELEPVATTS